MRDAYLSTSEIHSDNPDENGYSFNYLILEFYHHHARDWLKFYVQIHCYGSDFREGSINNVVYAQEGYSGNIRWKFDCWTSMVLSCLIKGCNNIRQTIFAQTAGVTELTIRNISEDLRNHLHLS